jgi:hypothetical protein
MIHPLLQSPSLNEKVQKLLDQFLESADPTALQPEDWKLYYDFICASYDVAEAERPRVSELAIRLRSAGFKEPGSLAVTYAHGLYILACRDRKAIYGSAFNP